VMQRATTRSRLTSTDGRHLLRRLAFAATPSLERLVQGRSADAALAALLRESRGAGLPTVPDAVRQPWTNTALRLSGMTDEQYDGLRATQVQSKQQGLELIRHWWLAEMIGNNAPLRENLVLFFEGTFGSATELVDAPHAIYGRNALIRRRCLDTIPALLEELIVDPAMMMQIGMDEHFRARVSDRPAKLILDHWTVGAGAYSDEDVENLSRALTGWRLTAPAGREPHPSPDELAVRAARRTSLVPIFVPEQADTRSKTILGTTGNFDAHSAIRLLARHPATARRFSQRLLQHLGIEVPNDRLVSTLTTTYQSTDGSIEALLRGIVRSAEFWSAASRWALIKSPAHMVVGACRQLELTSPPLATITSWMKATGQILFDTPNGGEGGWPGQEGWVTPPDRLAVRYQLPVALSGLSPALGIRAPGDTAVPVRLELGGALAYGSADALLTRLDPAPGLNVFEIRRAAATAGTGAQSEIVRRIMMTPQFQVA
jgi:uncharacterized protein (DUF1800 family)